MADEKVKTLEFIEDYRQYQVLWDRKHKDYSNKIKRNRALASLGLKHNYNIKMVKNKIKSLRSYFSKEHQKVLTKRSQFGTEEDNDSPWFAYKSLLFILDSVMPKESIESVEENSNTTSADESTDCHASQFLENDHNVYQPIRKRHIYETPTLDEGEKEAFSIVKTVSENTYNDDECATFGQLIACKLRKLSPRNRLLAQRRITDVCYSLELEEIDSVSGVHSEYSGVPAIKLSPKTPPRSMSSEDLMPQTKNDPDAYQRQT